MSTDPTPNSPDPEKVPPPETPTVESTAAAADQGAGEEAKTPRIKIGTQRPGVAAPRIEPRAKVAFRTPEGKTSEAAPAKPQAEGGEQSNAAAPKAPEPKPYTFKPKPAKSKFEIPATPRAKVEPPSLAPGCRRNWRRS